MHGWDRKQSPSIYILSTHHSSKSLNFFSIRNVIYRFILFPINDRENGRDVSGSFIRLLPTDDSVDGRQLAWKEQQAFFWLVVVSAERGWIDSSGKAVVGVEAFLKSLSACHSAFFLPHCQ